MAPVLEVRIAVTTTAQVVPRLVGSRTLEVTNRRARPRGEKSSPAEDLGAEAEIEHGARGVPARLERPTRVAEHEV